MEKYTLIGIGEILWDEFPGSKKLGGAPANFAFHASQLGAKGLIISCIGDDLEGKEIQTLLAQKQVHSLLPVDPDHPTGRVSVKTDKTGSPEYIIHENASWDFLPFEPDFHHAARTADVVCFGTLAQRNTTSGSTIKDFIRATQKDCLKIFDVNLRQHYYSKAILSELLGLADILKLNKDELAILTQMFLTTGEETACLEELISRFGLDYIVLTKGKDGSRIFADKTHDSIYTSKPIKMVDSVGAGDSFSAAVALGLLNGFSLDKINQMANTIAAYVCSKKGATPTIPQEIIQRIN